MKKEFSSEVNSRIFSIIGDLINKGLFRSEREYLLKNGYGTTKLSEIKNKKANFNIEDIGKILSLYPLVNGDWILSGRGAMWLDEEKNVDYKELYMIEKKKNDLVQDEVKDLFRKIGEKEGELKAYKDLVSSQESSQSSYSFGFSEQKSADSEAEYMPEKT